MKSIKKKLIFCLLAVFLLGIVPINAVNPLIFTAINDVIQLAPTPNTVPIRSGGTVYVLPETFTRLLGIKSIYNSSLDRLILYKNDRNLAFDMKNGTATDESGTAYQGAVRRNGRIYIPAKAVCDKFSLNYSYISASSLGGVVRINEGEPAYDDSFFLEKNAETMRNLYMSYNRNYMNEEPNSDPDDPDDPDDPVPKKTAALAVKCLDGSQLDAMMAELDLKNMDAVFFLNEETAHDGESVRKLRAGGYAVGILWEGSLEKLESANSAIKSQTMTKTNMVFFENAKELTDETEAGLINSGYKPMSATYNVSGRYQTMVANVKNHLARRTSVRLLFDTSEDSVRAVSSLASYFRQNNCTVTAVSVFD